MGSLLLTLVVVYLNLLFVVSSVSAQCDPNELLSCDPMVISSSVLCCNESTVCVEYSGTTVGSQATYNTSDDYCITTDLVRTCTSNMDWDGVTPSPSRAEEEQTLIEWNPSLLYLGLAFFFAGIIYTIAGSTTVYCRYKKYGGVIAKWYVIMGIIQLVIIAVSVVFWLALLGYSVNREFTERDVYLREEDSSCRSPTGRVAVRTALVVVCFVLANFAHSLGISFLSSMWAAVYRGKNGRCCCNCGPCGKKCGKCDNQFQKDKLGDDEKGNINSYPQPI